MRILPREVDPLVYNMTLEDPGGASFAGIGGLGDQVRELREVCLRSYGVNLSLNGPVMPFELLNPIR